MDETVSIGFSLMLSAGLMIAGIQALLHFRQRRHDGETALLRRQIEALQDRLFAVSESEERYRALIEAQGDVIIRQAADGTVLYANEAYGRLAGLAPQEVAVAEALRQHRLAVVERLPEVVREDGSRLVDERIAAPTGERWISWVETMIVAPDGGTEWLRVGRDMSDRIAATLALEEARRRAESASEAKSQFLAMVSHEVRTPLNGILGMTALLRQTTITPEQETYIGAVATSGQALLSLIDEILDFSRIEAGKLDLVSAEFDLHVLVEGVVELLAPRAQGKGIEIAASIGLDVPQKVIGDRDRLRQVLVNLAGNAVKFTEKGGVGLILRRGTAGRMVIEVADTGPGIPADKLDRIFDQFERGDGSASASTEGTGLGLSISRRIVERMQGEVSVTSRVGEGSIFTVTLPLPDADRGRPGLPRPDLRHMKVLVVSRSPFEAPFMLSRLDEAGARAERVASVPAAERRLAADAYDVLIVDRAMGDAAARRLAAAARALGVGRTLVLLSPFERRGFGSPNAAGFDGYLVKPVRPRSLYERMSAAEGAPVAAVEPRRAPKTARRRLRLLLAEDNEINALLAARVIEKLNGAVERVANGHEAVSRLTGRTRERYDAALIDIRMPGLDGLAAARAIRAFEEASGAETLTLVAVTANASERDREAALEAGFNLFLPKPVDPAVLASLIERLPPAPERRSAAA